VLQCIAMCCSVLQCAAVCSSMLQCVAVAVHCRVLQCLVVYCIVLQICRISGNVLHNRITGRSWCIRGLGDVDGDPTHECLIYQEISRIHVWVGMYQGIPP